MSAHRGSAYRRRQCGTMSNEFARELLIQAHTAGERRKAVAHALDLGMSLDRIEALLDWLDNVQPPMNFDADAEQSPEDEAGPEGSGN